VFFLNANWKVQKYFEKKKLKVHLFFSKKGHSKKSNNLDWSFLPLSTSVMRIDQNISLEKILALKE
jgi:hypothetical protein